MIVWYQSDLTILEEDVMIFGCVASLGARDGAAEQHDLAGSVSDPHPPLQLWVADRGLAFPTGAEEGELCS